jgi:hypothetical protein
MTNPDFSRIHVMLCSVGNERVHDLYAATFNILMNVENAVVTIAYNKEESFMDEAERTRKALLFALAKQTTNALLWINYPAEFSKAKMIAQTFDEWQNRFGAFRTMSENDRCWYLNVDDDYMIPYKTLKLFELASKADKPDTHLYVYGQFDIINYRDYEDWDDTKLGLEDMFEFVKVNGIRCLPNHLMKEIPDQLITFKMPKQSTGAYMADMLRVNSDMFQVLNEWPKGKRGYDEFWCNAIGGVEWIFGSNSYHTDRTMAHVDGKIWHTDVFRDDLMLDGTVKGRQPSQLGEKSIPRAEKPVDAPEIPSVGQQQGE